MSSVIESSYQSTHTQLANQPIKLKPMSNLIKSPNLKCHENSLTSCESQNRLTDKIDINTENGIHWRKLMGGYIFKYFVFHGIAISFPSENPLPPHLLNWLFYSRILNSPQYCSRALNFLPIKLPGQLRPWLHSARHIPSSLVPSRSSVLEQHIRSMATASPPPTPTYESPVNLIIHSERTSPGVLAEAAKLCQLDRLQCYAARAPTNQHSSLARPGKQALEFQERK